MNDLITRQHVDTIISADDREEYHNWIDTLDDNDDTPEMESYVSEITCPAATTIEKQIDATIQRQCQIAAKKGMSLDQYREHLADRHDILMDNILHARAMKRIIDAK